MRGSWIPAAAALLIALTASLAPAQAPRLVLGADTLPARELPRAVAEPIVAFFNHPETIHFSGRTRVPADRTVVGDVAVLGGPLSIAGRIDGSVVVIDGDVELLPGAEVTGDLTVVGGMAEGLDQASVGGEIVTYSERLGYRREGDRIALEPRAGARDEDPWMARSDFLIATGRSYNRAEGLPITLGPVIETAGSNPLRVRAMAIYRTESGATLDPERLGYYIRAEQFLGGRHSLRVGGTLHSVIDPIEDWHLLNIENSLATFLLHRDFRDHFEREGWSAFATVSPPRSAWTLSLIGRSERHRSVASGSPWTLFRNQESWRPQPLVAEGHLTTLNLEGRFDTRNSTSNPSHGWYASGSIERTLRSSLARPEGVLTMPLPIADPVFVPAERFDGWSAGILEVRRYNRLSPEARLNLRLLAGGSLDGSALPPQRQHALGGEGSLPGYALFRLDCGARAEEVFRAEAIAAPVISRRDTPPVFFPGYGCDRFALFQAEYRGKLSLRLGWGGAPWGDPEQGGWDLGWAASPDWVAFIDAGQGWKSGGLSEDFALDFGVGLLFDRVGVYAATPLKGQGGLNLFVRLGPRF